MVGGWDNSHYVDPWPPEDGVVGRLDIKGTELGVPSDRIRIGYSIYNIHIRTQLFDTDTDTDIIGCEKNDIRIRQNRISDTDRILAVIGCLLNTPESRYTNTSFIFPLGIKDF